MPRDFCPNCGQVIVLLSLFVYCNFVDTVASQVHRMWETFIHNDPSFAKGDILCWYQSSNGSKWAYDLIDHKIMNLDELKSPPALLTRSLIDVCG